MAKGKGMVRGSFKADQAKPTAKGGTLEKKAGAIPASAKPAAKNANPAPKKVKG